jgi:hypothetical protein
MRLKRDRCRSSTPYEAKRPRRARKSCTHFAIGEGHIGEVDYTVRGTQDGSVFIKVAPFDGPGGEKVEPIAKALTVAPGISLITTCA